MNKGKKLTIIISLVWTLVLLTTVTYSWIARSWTPKLEYPKMSIATTGALVITIDDAIYNEVDVNKLRGVDEFSLKQVSSSDGINFYSADFNPILEGGVPVYDKNVLDKYIETEFWLKTQYESDNELADRKKEIFISSDSYIKCEYEDESEPRVDLAIRISIDIQNGPTYILCVGKEGDEDGLDGIYSKKAASENSVGKEVFDENSEDGLNQDAYVPVMVYDLHYFDGTEDDYGNKKTLFTIDSASAQKVTVRIWLEGCDENCVNEIAGKKLSLVLKFDSREVGTEVEQE